MEPVHDAIIVRCPDFPLKNHKLSCARAGGYGQVCRWRDIWRDILRDIWAKLGLSRFGCFLFVNGLLYVSYHFKTPVWINNSIFFGLLYYFYLWHIGLNLLIIAEHSFTINVMFLGNLRAQPSYLKAKLESQYWDQEWQPLNHQPLCQVIRMLRNSQLRILQNLQPRRRSLQAPTRTKMPMVRRKPTEVQRLAVPCSKLI